MPAQFSPDHPLWDTFIGLRRSGYRISDLVDRARADGYDLTWHQIYNGMRRAPATFGLPDKSALWLGHKYVAIEGKISAYKTMTQLLGETLERLQKLYGDLASADTSLRRELLEHQYIPAEINRAFVYSREIAHLDMEIRRALGPDAVTPVGALSVGTQNNLIVLSGKDLSEFSQQLSQEFVKRIGAGSAEDAAVDQFGHDNVRAVNDAEEDVTDEDETE